MPKEIKDVKAFMELLTEKKNVFTSKNKDKKHPEKVFERVLTVKHNEKNMKFKLRTKKYLVTFKTENKEM